MINTQKYDFSTGPVWKRIVSQAIPLTVAQLVQLLYHVVDRVYLGHIGDGNSIALTGVGLTFPVVTLIAAFTALFGIGGVPLFSIERGAGNDEKAGRILGNSFALLLGSSFVLTALCYLFMKPVLFAFGASKDSFVYAREYLNIYLAGTVFSMLGTGLNGYINAQGFPKVGMYSITIGAACNIILDPIFIFWMDMGVSGAALATVISQIASAVWVLRFLTGPKVLIPLRRKNIVIQKQITGDICKLGLSNFIMQATNCLVQVTCNATLQTFGGDLYVGIMTVTNSVREIFSLPVSGISSGSQTVVSYNFGAREYARVRSGIRFTTVVSAVYTMIAWLVIFLFPGFWFGIFSEDLSAIGPGIEAMQIYFFGFVFMTLQFAGQSTFQALGDARHAIFFSLLRKAIIVTPLTLLLPLLGFGVLGVFLAEPVSNVIGGLACYITMRRTVYKKIEQAIRGNI